MKGLIFNLLEEVVSSDLGEDGWYELLGESGLEGVYTSLGSYADEELTVLVEAASGRLGMTPDETVRWFGRNAMPLLAERYPQFFEPHDSTGPFLLTLNDIIHAEVRKLYPGAEVPVFDHRVHDDGRVVMGYSSRRGLCSFGEGLIEGAADHYGQRAAIEQPSCINRGDGECVFEIFLSG